MKILIAEDDKDTREGLIDVFQSEGYTVEAVSSGKAAVTIFGEFHPDLVCLDIMMPGLSGYDACRAIRKIDRDIPILFLSAKSEEIDKVLGLELGADDYVVKPFGVREILARVKALLRRSNAEREPEKDKQPFQMNDLKVVPDELRAYRGEKTIDLTEREIIILDLLFKNAGKVVGRSDLFKYAWGLNHIPNSRTLDQTVSQLRKKVEKDPSNPELIKTVHTSGYRWDPV